MPSGGPDGTTLKLDYWDERRRTGTLFPTVCVPHRMKTSAVGSKEVS
jgi:hypothetical protein